ncbi:Conserved_hypothetical protein [Hexamita inflata]|uniref:RING-type domain-containing protein n=1 Tax=Hexamita inflata TaxID=28002 RepID=A0AA86PP53_9EUKA|nr:Conserved hypothetical protein [Hexamita inflata]
MCDICTEDSDSIIQFCNHTFCVKCASMIASCSRKCPCCNTIINNRQNYGGSKTKQQILHFDCNKNTLQFDEVYCDVHSDTLAVSFDSVSNIFMCDLCLNKKNIKLSQTNKVRVILPIFGEKGPQIQIESYYPYIQSKNSPQKELFYEQNIEKRERPEYKYKLEFNGFEVVHKVKNICVKSNGLVIKNYKTEVDVLKCVNVLTDKENYFALFNKKKFLIQNANGNIFVDLDSKFEGKTTQTDRKYKTFDEDKISTFVKQYYIQLRNQYTKTDTIQLISNSTLCFSNSVANTYFKNNYGIFSKLFELYQFTNKKQKQIQFSTVNLQIVDKYNCQVGQYVVRNHSEWSFGRQDHSKFNFVQRQLTYYLGIIQSINPDDLTCEVFWMNSTYNTYSIGKNNQFNLLLVKDQNLIEKLLYGTNPKQFQSINEFLTNKNCCCSVSIINVALLLFGNTDLISGIQKYQDTTLISSQCKLFTHYTCYLQLFLQQSTLSTMNSFKFLKLCKNQLKTNFMQKIQNHFISCTSSPLFTSCFVTSIKKPVVVCTGPEWVFESKNKIGILHQITDRQLQIQWVDECNQSSLKQSKDNGIVQVQLEQYQFEAGLQPVNYYEHFVTKDNFQHERLVGPTRFCIQNQIIGILEASYEETALVKWWGGDTSICQIGIGGELTYLGRW